MSCTVRNYSICDCCVLLYRIERLVEGEYADKLISQCDAEKVNKQKEIQRVCLVTLSCVCL